VAGSDLYPGSNHGVVFLDFSSTPSPQELQQVGAQRPSLETAVESKAKTWNDGWKWHSKRNSVWSVSSNRWDQCFYIEVNQREHQEPLTAAVTAVRLYIKRWIGQPTVSQLTTHWRSQFVTHVLRNCNLDPYRWCCSRNFPWRPNHSYVIFNWTSTLILLL